jgi:hypothetical protein
LDNTQEILLSDLTYDDLERVKNKTSGSGEESIGHPLTTKMGQ